MKKNIKTMNTIETGTIIREENMKKTKMKAILRRVCCALLAAVMMMAAFSSAETAEAASSSTFTAKVSVTYHQTEARSMLSSLNSFRTGSEAWYYNSSGKKVTCSGLGKLTYDYGLEKAAMQRAAEAVLSFSHTRPNGTSYSKVYSDLGYDVTTYVIGENLAAGYSSASSALNAWKETDEDYSGQGHRRNMLSSKYKYVGISYVTYDGTGYWVMCLSNKKISTTKTTAVDVSKTKSVKVKTSYVKSSSMTSSSSSLSVKVGKTISKPSVTLKIKLSESWPYSLKKVTTSYTYKISDTKIAKINSDGKIQGVKAGSTTLTITSASGKSVKVPIKVTSSGSSSSSSSGSSSSKTSISKATVTLSSSTYTYNGKAKKPTPTVKLNGKTLTKGTDYTVSYSNNTKAGTATVTIKGTGNYSGSATKTFTIKKRDLTASGIGFGYQTPSYTGSALKPTITVQILGTSSSSVVYLTEGTDYTVTYKNNTNAGTGTYTVIGTGSCTGTVTKSFTIAQANLPYVATATLSKTSYTYDGTAKKPSVTVVNKWGKTLTKGTDYTVSYSNNTKAGTATVTIKGTGNYKGTITKTFTIK